MMTFPDYGCGGASKSSASRRRSNPPCADGVGTALYVNGQLLPTLTVQPGEWVRLRMTFSSIEKTIRLAISKKTDAQKIYLGSDDATCEIQLLAKDGMYLHEMPRKVPSMAFFPGSRSDVAVRCHCHPGVSKCSVPVHSFGIKYVNEGHFNTCAFHIEVKGPPVSSPALPSVKVRRPCYLVDLQHVQVPAENQHRFNFTPKHEIQWQQSAKDKTWGVYMKAMTYSPAPNEVEPLALGRLTGGQVHTIQVHGFHIHPFHLHVNPYQIQEWAYLFKDVYFNPGDWHDVIMQPSADRVMDGVVRIQTDRFAGAMVVHCHFLEHEDEGMMSWFWIPKGDKPHVWSGAEEVDPTCYREYFPASGSGPRYEIKGKDVYSNSKYLADFQQGMSLEKCKHYCSNWADVCDHVCKKEKMCNLGEDSTSVSTPCWTKKCVGFNMHGDNRCTLFPENVKLVKGKNSHGIFYAAPDAKIAFGEDDGGNSYGGD